MAQLPPVHMKLNSDNFDLLMTILEVHAEERDVPGLANDAHDLMDKRMRFSRLCTGPEGQDYVDIFMYESEAVEMIWQLLFAAADADMAVNDYHSRLQRGGMRLTRYFVEAARITGLRSIPFLSIIPIRKTGRNT